jgi:carbon monoxide dehydrogenase subunit G
MEIRETVELDRPPAEVFPFIAEFEHLAEWDPGTIEVRSRTPGPLAVGTAYEVVSEFRGRQTELVYTVTALDPPHRIELRGVSKTVHALDEISFEAQGSGTRVTYVARFRFQSWLVRLIAPLVLGRAFAALGRDAAQGMRDAVDRMSVE